jgi:hypothetical protein
VEFARVVAVKVAIFDTFFLVNEEIQLGVFKPYHCIQNEIAPRMQLALALSWCQERLLGLIRSLLPR